MEKKHPKKKKLLVIGLTGSIGMGKSTAAEFLRKLGASVFDADKSVHELLRKGGEAVEPVRKLFPKTVKRGAIDRKALGSFIFSVPSSLRALEKRIHPLVRRKEREFLKKAKQKGVKTAVLEMPLLFETGADKRCDLTFCVTAPRAMQRLRVLKRAGMTPEKFQALIKQQMPDKEKRARADFVIDTSKGMNDMRRQLTRLWKKIQMERI